eukprot:g2280.t1
MSAPHESDLCNFFVFARYLGVYDEAASLEERVEKILYFYPQDTPAEVQLGMIDTCEGVIDVTRTFAKDEAVNSMRTEDHRYSFVECEPDVWVVVVVSNPTVFVGADASSSASDGSSSSSSSRKGGGGRYETCAETVNETNLKATMHRAYAMYRMFHGTLTAALTPLGPIHELLAWRKKLRKALQCKELVDNGDTLPTAKELGLLSMLADGTIEGHIERLGALSPATAVRRRLDALMTLCVEGTGFERLHLFHDLDGFLFYPAERRAYMEMQGFANALRTEVPQVHQTALFYKGHLLWSTVHYESLRTIHHWLRLKLLRAAGAAHAAALKAAAG